MDFPEINFSDLEIREIGSWPLILRIGVLIGVCAVTFIGAYMLIIEPHLMALNAQKKQEADDRKEFKDKYNLAANLDAYQKQMADVKQQYKEMLKQLPATDQVPELIDTISRQAENDGLRYDSIKPGTAQSLMGFYQELSLDLILHGSYNGLGAFVSDLTKIPRIVTLHDFTLKKEASSGKGSISSDQLSLTLELKTYWLAPESDQQNAKAGEQATGAVPNAAGSAPTIPAKNNPPPGKPGMMHPPGAGAKEPGV